MRKKVTLQVKEMVDADVVKIVMVPKIHVDDHFFTNTMEENVEDDSCKNYPVQISAVKINWLLSHNGEKYLEAILNSENLDMLANQTNQTIIEFLYQSHVSFIKKY